MTANITFNPIATTTAAGSFNISSGGQVQGTAYADPSARFALNGGTVASSETLPMWGGVGITENIPASGLAGYANPHFIGRATSLVQTASGGLTGFTVFDQSHATVVTPQSPVPLAGSLMSFNFYRLGSGARIAVKADPALASLDGGIIGQQVSWDFGGQFLSPYTAGWAANVITNAVYSAGQVTLTTTSAHGLSVGTDLDLSGFVTTGTTLNGTFTALTGTTGSTIVIALSSTFGTVTTYGTLVAGGGALNVRVLGVEVGNSMTVNYDPVTGFATWNRGGTTAIILI